MSGYRLFEDGNVRGHIVLEQLEERIVLDAAPYDGVWNDLGDGYWFLYEPDTNDHNWWYSNFANDEWLKFDPEAQQWSWTSNNGATYTDVGDPGAVWADPDDPDDTFLFDGELHTIGYDPDGNAVSFEYQSDFSTYFRGHYSIEGTTLDFRFDYLTSQWYRSPNAGASWFAFGSPGASDDFMFDGSVYFGAALGYDYHYDTAANEGHWVSQGSGSDFVYDYGTGLWTRDGLAFDAESSSEFYYDGNVHDLGGGLMYRYWDGVNQGEWWWNDDSVTLVYDYTAGDWFLWDYTNGVAVDIAYDSGEDAGLIHTLNGGGWANNIGGSDFNFRFDAVNDDLYWQYDSAHADGFLHQFAYEVDAQQWWQDMVWTATAGDWLMVGDQGASGDFIYDGITHVIGTAPGGFDITYEYLGAYNYGTWYSLGAYDVDGSSYHYELDYIAAQWWEQRPDTSWHTMGDTGSSSQFLWDGATYTGIWNGSFQYDAATAVSTWDMGTYVVTYDRDTDAWEINGSPFEAEPFTHFYYDGEWHEMANGASYQYVYDAGGGDAYWWDHGLYLNYDFATQTWYANPADSWYEVVAGQPRADFFYDIFNNSTGWWELDNGHWFKHDGDREAVYWWTYSMLHSVGQELWFTYDDRFDIWWWYPPDGTEWVEFTSPGDIDRWVFDGGTHIVGDDGSGHDISFYFDEARYGYYEIVGTQYFFAYDYVTGQWWINDNYGNMADWSVLGGEGYDSWFVFDGQYHDLPNGMGFQYDFGANDAYWNVEGIEFIHDYDTNDWWVIDPVTDYRLLFHVGGDSVTDAFLNGEWHDYDENEQIRVDTDLGRIYWTANNSGTVYSYYYDLEARQWWNDATGTAFGSEGDVPFFMFDEEWYDVVNSSGDLKYTFHLMDSEGIWDYGTSFTRWAYEYDTGQWWNWDNTWSTYGSTGEDSRFIHDGMTYSFGSNFEYYFDVGADLGYWSVDAGALSELAYDYEERNWYWVDSMDNLHQFDPVNSEWNMVLYRQELQLDDAFSIEIDDLNDHVYWWLLDGSFGFRYDMGTSGWEVYAESTDSWVTTSAPTHDLYNGSWDWTYSGTSVNAQIDLSAAEATIYWNSTPWFAYEMNGDDWWYYDFEVLNTWTETDYDHGYWAGGGFWHWQADTDLGITANINMSNNNQAWYENGANLYLRDGTSSVWLEWNGSSWSATPYTGAFYYGGAHWNWFIDDHVSATDNLFDNSSYWFYDLENRFYVDDAGNWSIWDLYRDGWTGVPYLSGDYDGAYTYNWSWNCDARMTADVGMGFYGGTNSDQDWYYDGSTIAQYVSSEDRWYFDYGSGLQATAFDYAYYEGSNDWWWDASWQTTARWNLDNGNQAWWFNGSNLYQYTTATDQWDEWRGYWAATPYESGYYVDVDGWHWDADANVTAVINNNTGFQLWQYNGVDRFRLTSGDDWQEWTGSSWVDTNFDDGWYDGSNWWHWEDNRITGDVDMAPAPGSDRTEYYHWDLGNLIRHIDVGGGNWEWQIWTGSSWAAYQVTDGHYDGYYDWWWDVDNRVDHEMYLDTWDGATSMDYRFYFNGSWRYFFDASRNGGLGQFQDRYDGWLDYSDGYYFGQGSFLWVWNGGISDDLWGRVYYGPNSGYDNGDQVWTWDSFGGQTAFERDGATGIWYQWNGSSMIETDYEDGRYDYDSSTPSMDWWLWEAGDRLTGYVDITDRNPTTGDQWWYRSGTGWLYNYNEASDLWQEWTGSVWYDRTDVIDAYYVDWNRWNWQIDDRVEQSIDVGNWDEYWIYQGTEWYCLETSSGHWWHNDGGTWEELAYSGGTYDGAGTYTWTWNPDVYITGYIEFDTGHETWTYDADGAGAGGEVNLAGLDGGTGVWYEWNGSSWAATSFIDGDYLGNREWSFAYDSHVDRVTVLSINELNWRFDGNNRTAYEVSTGAWKLVNPHTGSWEQVLWLDGDYTAGTNNWEWIGESNVTSVWEFDSYDEFFYYNSSNRIWYDYSADRWFDWNGSSWDNRAFEGHYLGNDEFCWVYYENNDGEDRIHYDIETISWGSQRNDFWIWNDGGDGFDSNRVNVFAPMNGGAVNYYDDRDYLIEDAIYMYGSSWGNLNDLTNNLSYISRVLGPIDMLAISNEGDTDVVRLAGNYIHDYDYSTYQSYWTEIGTYMDSGGEIQFYASNIGVPGSGAETVLSNIAADTGVAVYASDDLTGTSGGGDWILEWGSDGAIRSGPSGQLIFNPGQLDSCHWHRVT